MADDTLRELQRLFAEAVLVTGPYGSGVDPARHGFWVPVGGCWFREHVPGIDACGGDFGPNHIEACHWIKRQDVERWIENQYGPYVQLATNLSTWQIERDELVALAAWDPRNAVPGCEKHHRRFDGHRVPLPKDQLIVPRELVPGHVTEFCADYGLEEALKRKIKEV